LTLSFCACCGQKRGFPVTFVSLEHDLKGQANSCRASLVHLVR
jgi:hypothetical protein